MVFKTLSCRERPSPMLTSWEDGLPARGVRDSLEPFADPALDDAVAGFRDVGVERADREDPQCDPGAGPFRESGESRRNSDRVCVASRRNSMPDRRMVRRISRRRRHRGRWTDAPRRDAGRRRRVRTNRGHERTVGSQLRRLQDGPDVRTWVIERRVDGDHVSGHCGFCQGVGS